MGTAEDEARKAKRRAAKKARRKKDKKARRQRKAELAAFHGAEAEKLMEQKQSLEEAEPYNAIETRCMQSRAIAREAARRSMSGAWGGLQDFGMIPSSDDDDDALRSTEGAKINDQGKGHAIHANEMTSGKADAQRKHSSGRRKYKAEHKKRRQIKRKARAAAVAAAHGE